jgi:SAM-dependent methyltransferase
MSAGDRKTAPAKDFTAGSIGAFRSSWSALPAGERYHFKRGEPENQIQFAFQNHWRVFQQVMGDVRAGRALEVGCGRGSMGAFFAEAGFETHLLDSSVTALDIARRNFDADALPGQVVCGDGLQLPYEDGSFDVVVSIGLLEHFEDIGPPVAEQLRVLRPGGVFLGYVVPERRVSVQVLGAPINAALGLQARVRGRRNGTRGRKSSLYRNRYSSGAYLGVLRDLGAREMGSFGMFPVPLVSHSPTFPFSLMAPPAERRLVGIWRRLLSVRPGPRDPWTCPERWGLAFLVWARK